MLRHGNDPFKCWSPFHNQILQWIFITLELEEFSIDRFYPLAERSSSSANTNLHKSGTLSSETSSAVFTFMDWNATFFSKHTGASWFIPYALGCEHYIQWKQMVLSSTMFFTVSLSSQQAMKVLSNPLNSWACISLKSDLRFKEKLCKNVKEATAINRQQQHI